jgi:hypothetical protein
LHTACVLGRLKITEAEFLQKAHFLAFDALAMLDGLGFRTELRFNGVISKPKPKLNPNLPKGDDTPAVIIVYFLSDHGTASIFTAYQPTGAFKNPFIKAIPPGAIADRIKGEINFLLMPPRNLTGDTLWSVQSTLKMPNINFDDRSSGSFPLTSTIPTSAPAYKMFMEQKITQGMALVLQKQFGMYQR